MTGYGDKSNEELASAFIVGTCQLIPRSSFIHSAHRHNLMASKNPTPIEYLIMCGSNAEFYIRPIMTCIDDLDFLIVRIDELAFNEDFPALPSDMSGLSDRITCHKIEPYDIYPGFVRLRIRGEVTYNWKYNRYEFNHTADTNNYWALDLDSDSVRFAPVHLKRDKLINIITGPAVRQRSDDPTAWFNKVDLVKTMWCPRWPREAQGWLNRSRISGWPTTDTITEVAQTGCNLVFVKHRFCRDDILQWRFSFSLAEVILLQSWTQVQQIVYHLLRFFAKRELILKDCPKEDEVLSSYHLKTLMLWTCEEMSPELWNSSSVIAICCDLLKTLSGWLKKRHCPNYFIPEANLFQDQSRSKILETTVGKLDTVCSSEILSHWFVENYILPFIWKRWKPVDNMPHFVDYMLPLFEVWKANELISLDFYFRRSFACSQCCRPIIKQGFNSGVHDSFNTASTDSSMELKANSNLSDLPTLHNVSCIKYHDSLLFILHTAYGLECRDISSDSNLFVEAINVISMQPTITMSEYHNFPKIFTTLSSRFQFLCSQNLMQNLTGLNSYLEFRLLSLTIDQLLRKVLKYDDTIPNGIIPAALAYLAAIHFATSEYQEATRLCSAVLVDKTSQEDKETLNAGCLFFIDDIARIVGLCVLKKQITENNLRYINRRLYLDLRLSPKVFAQYLSVLSGERGLSRRTEFYNELPDHLFPMDINLSFLSKPKCTSSMKLCPHCNVARQIVYRRPYSLTETEASSMNHPTVNDRVLDMLMDYALENMTSFYNAIRKDFGVDCNTADCYRALYLYKCRQYNQVLHLCEIFLKISDLQNQLKNLAFANILLLPPLDSFFDRDVQSLLGLHTLFYYLSPLNDDMGKVVLTEESTFKQWFASHVYTYKRELTLSLGYSYSIKCQYLLGRHFLAKYLKLRCRIDCKLPFLEALTDVVVHKTNLPFEHIIRRFLLRKLHVANKNSVFFA